MLLAGLGNSAAVFDDLAPRLAAGRPDARIAVWPDAGHDLFLEQPARTVAAIEAFLAPGASTP